jgi:very-short-patch-repair endonuclease
MVSIEQKIDEIACESARMAMRTWDAREVVDSVDSPIEKLFALALWSRSSWTKELVFHPRYHPDNSLEDLECHIDDGDCMMHAAAQVQVGEYRVDFAIVRHRSRGVRPIVVVVECDGHEFHEKTKEQARRDKRRDRKLTLAGCHVLRFSGSELWADAGRCAGESLQVVRKIVRDDVDLRVGKLSVTVDSDWPF